MAELPIIQDKVKCVSCGFLSRWALFPKLRDPVFFEMSKEEREQGAGVSAQDLESGAIGMHLPMCARGEHDLWAELMFADAPLRTFNNKSYYEPYTQAAEAAKEIFNKERICDEWQPYTEGFTPKEHLEMRYAQGLELSRRDYEKRTEASRRRYEERQRIKDANIEKGRFKTHIVLVVTGLIVALGQIVAAVILTRENKLDEILRILIIGR